MTTAKHSLILTKGAASLLSNAIASPGVLADPVKLYRAAEFAEDHLAALEPVPPISGNPTAEDLTRRRAWERETLPSIEISERTRDALKELVATSISKGYLGGNHAVLTLMKQFGLGEG